MDHTVIDAGDHRLLIGTIPVAPANYRYPGDHVGSARPANGRNRRVSLLPGRPSEGRLPATTAAARLGARELVFLPPYLPFAIPSGSPQLSGELSFLNDLVAATLRRFRTFALNDTTIT
jgi:hypothetical protein